MTPAELFACLRERQVLLWAEGDRLRYKAPAGGLTPDLRAELVARKAEMLALLHAAQSSDAESVIPIAPRNADPPLSFAQQRLWFLDRLSPNSPLYNLFLAVQLTGALDRMLLARSLRAIIQRHEILRTTFALRDDQPIQRIAAPPRAVAPILLLDIQRCAAPDSDALIRRLATAEAQRPFDLASGPLMRTTLLRRDPASHVLLLTMHHSIADGWSLGLLVRELTACYAAFSAGQPIPLTALPIQYADFALWQRQRLQGAVLETQRAYWRRQLSDLPTLALPTDFAYPPVQTVAGAHQPLRLAPERLAALHALSQRAGSTLFMTLLAAFQLLLARQSDQTDLAVGSPIAGRTQRETEELIGCFVNTLVLRTDLTGARTVGELLERVRTVCLGAYAHQDLPFEQLVADLHPARDTSRHPLFQVFLVLQNTPTPALELSGLRLAPLELESGMSKFDLSLSLSETPDGLSGLWEYRTDLFTATTISRLSGQIQALLAALDGDLAQPLAQLSLLTPAERQQLLVEWNDTAGDRRQEAEVRSQEASRLLHERIAAQAARSPDAVAVIFGDRCLTYAELDLRANQLARHLRALGVGPDAPTGICAERSLELVIGLLGILKAGSAYLPLDPSYPAERLRFMLEDSRARILIIYDLEKSDAIIVHRTSEIVNLRADWPQIARRPGTAPASGATLDNLAYVIYTSGSTGRAKGVLCTHRGIVNRLRWMQATYRLDAGDVVLQKTPTSFDVSVWELFWPLLSGARLALARPEGHKDPAYLAALIGAQRITTLHFVPSMLEAFLEQPDLSACRGLRRVICSGEALPVELQTRCLARIDAALHNLYGPTEASVDVTFWACRSATDARSAPIGRPVANTQIYLLDRRMDPAPIGVAGELYIGGVQLARGYLGRPDLTAERFVPNPFASVGSMQSPADRASTTADCRLPTAGCRLYKTGDLARYRADGAIEFLGRRDHQVKLRGFRIELGEIEAVLLQHSALRACAVALREDTPPASEYPDQRLVAYIVQGSGGGGQGSGEPASEVPIADPRSQIPALRAFLAERLPSYMIPSAFVVLEELPTTPSCKLDRRALPSPNSDRAASGAAFVALRTSTEELLSGIWGAVLGMERVGGADNFFALGGHSLLATQVVARVRQVFGVELPLRELFEHPTIADLAARIDALRLGEQPALPALAPMPRAGMAPLSFAQERLWFLDQFAPGSVTYSIPAAVRVQGALHLPALAQSFGALIQRHETLRTTFATVDGTPFQVIALPALLPLRVADLTALPTDQRELVAHHLATAEAQQPFDLTRGLLLRTVLLRHAPDDHTLLLTMHHIVSDAWSIGVLIRELAERYAAYATGQDARLPPLPIQYADYALWQRQWLQSAVLETQLAYWRAQLAGSPPVLELPTDRPRPARQSFRGGHERFQISAALRDELHTLARQSNATLFMTLLAVFQVLLARYSGQDDIVVGSPIANRTQQATEGLIGFFVNTLALRTDLSGNPSFRDLLARVRSLTLDAYTHQDAPFEKLVEELQPERDLSHTPLFQVLFALQNAPLQRVELPNLTLQPQARTTATAKVDLTLALSEAAEGLEGAWEYAADLFDAATIARMAGQFQTLLAGILADPTRRIADLPLLTARERQQLLVEWNASQHVAFQHSGLHQLFEAQAARRPDAVAVTCEDRQLTYHALNARANQLAHALRAIGVGPDTLVALSVERSLDLVIGILGILKAGGAYAPIDPSYPAQRRAYLLADTQAPVIVTQARLVADLPPHHPQALCLDADPRIARQPRTDLPPIGEPQRLAYVIYTSGSTGAPKGVTVSHANVVRLFAATDAWFRFDADQVWTLFHSYAFDFSVWEIWGALLYGGRMVVVPYWVSRAPDAFYDLLNRERVTALNQTPSAFGQLVQAEASLKRIPPLALRWIIFGGEALALERLKPWFERHGDRIPQLVNMYGITETTVHVTYRPVCAADLRGAAGSMIGARIPDLQIYVLDRQLQPAPIGVPGELYIGGSGLARGYHRRPDLTAARFIPNPFASVGSMHDAAGSAPTRDDRRLPAADCRLPAADCRLYKTGDRARYLANGDLEYLGRLDQQVKIRGFRIEVGEIEAALRQHPAIRDAVVLVQQQADDTPRLVAYLAIQPPAPTLADLRRFLQAALPEYMLPAAFVLRDRLPLTANGKLDLRALATSSAETKLSDGAAYVPPRTEIETLLVNAWQKVLGVTPIGIHDNYFALGGDSIRVIQLLHAIKQYHLSATVPDLFQHQTIELLAQYLSERERKTEDALPMELVCIPAHIRELLPDDCEDAYPAARMQELMLFHYANNQQNTGIYHVQQSFHIHSPGFSLETLSRALALLVQKHTILRTVFFTEHVRRPIQIVKQALAVSVAVDDIRNMNAPEQERHVQAAMQRDRIDLFDTNDLDAPLFRFKLFLRSETTFEFLMSIHHALDDGWGNIEFLKELVDVYLSLRSGEDVVIVPPVNTYKEFVALEQALIASDEALQFWNNHLSKYKHQPLPQRTLWPHETSDGNLQHLFDSELTNGLQQVSQRLHCSLKAIFLSAYLDLIQGVSGAEVVSAGVVVNGRSARLTDPLKAAGLFWNIIPLCYQIEEGEKDAQIRNVQQLLIDAEPYASYPLLELLEQRQEDELFFATFNFLHFHNLKTITQDADIRILQSRGHDRFHFPLNTTISVNPFDSQVAMRIEYDSRYFSLDSITAMVSAYTALLSRVVILVVHHRDFEGRVQGRALPALENPPITTSVAGH